MRDKALTHPIKDNVDYGQINLSYVFVACHRTARHRSYHHFVLLYRIRSLDCPPTSSMVFDMDSLTSIFHALLSSSY
jgi:hypothetical protein